MIRREIPEEKLDVLAIGPHRDDVELCCGGTLVRLVDLGHRVGIADLTEGEMGTRGTAEQRAEEAACAARVMGVSYRVNLGLPDGNIQPTPEATDAIIRLIRATRPVLVLCPRPDEGRHPDHGAVGRLVPEAAFRAGFRKWETGQPHHRPLRIINYMMHTMFVPTFVVDISDQWERKLEAIRCYKSQLGVPGASSEEEQTYISSPQFLDMIEARARYFGSQIAATYGEPFFQRETVRIDDPMMLVTGSIEQFSDQVSGWRRPTTS